MTKTFHCDGFDFYGEIIDESTNKIKSVSYYQPSKVTMFKGETKATQFNLSKPITDDSGKQFEIINITDYAFGQTLFTSIIIPNSIIYIGKYAFYSTDATTILLPDSLQFLGTSAFESSKITRLDLSKTQLTSIGYQCFWGSSLISIILPEALEVIPQNAFRECMSLYEVTLPSSLTRIDQYAFIFTPIVRLDFTKNRNVIFTSYSLTGMSSLQYLYLPYCTSDIKFSEIINTTMPTIYFRNRIIHSTEIHSLPCNFAASCKIFRSRPILFLSTILIFF